MNVRNKEKALWIFDFLSYLYNLLLWQQYTFKNAWKDKYINRRRDNKKDKKRSKRFSQKQQDNDLRDGQLMPYIVCTHLNFAD